jgi:hypothetical protein
LLLLKQHCAMQDLEGRLAEQEQHTIKPYVLPDNVITTGELEGHVLKIISRVGGDTTYVVSENYIPPETSVEYVIRTDTLAMEELEAAQQALWELQQQALSPEDSLRLDSLEQEITRISRTLTSADIDYRTHGFCLFPELGVGVDTDFRPNIQGGARLYFIKRFGLGLHAAGQIPVDSTQQWRASLGAFGDYRIPGWDNSAVFGSLDYEFGQEQFKAMFGLQVYLK